MKSQSIIDNVIPASHTLNSRHRNKGRDTPISVLFCRDYLTKQTFSFWNVGSAPICARTKKLREMRRSYGDSLQLFVIQTLQLTRNCSLEWHSNCFIALGLTCQERNNSGNQQLRVQITIRFEMARVTTEITLSKSKHNENNGLIFINLSGLNLRDGIMLGILLYWSWDPHDCCSNMAYKYQRLLMWLKLQVWCS